MIDINTIRENPEAMVESLKYRGSRDKIKWVDSIRKHDKEWRELLSKNNALRKSKNEITRNVASLKKAGKDVKLLIRKSKNIDIKISENEKKMIELKADIDYCLLRLPNILHTDVPKGKDDSESVPIRFWGVPKVWKMHLGKFKEQTLGKVNHTASDENLISHQDLCEKADLLDTSKAAELSGSRFYFFKNELVILEMALMRFAVDILHSQGYTPMEPPFLVRKKVEAGATSFDAFEDVLYKIEGEDLYLIPTSEHPLVNYHANEVLNQKDLPKKYVGFSACFRKEAGTHGKDTKGFFRVHQFNKVEQVIICKPEDSWDFHEKMLGMTEEIFKQLEIPYRIVLACSGDTPKTTAKMYDLEAWFPSMGRYKEAASCSNCLDWQSRRLNIRYFEPNGKKVYAHTLNSTGITNTRGLIALLENNQTKDGINIPKALWKYTGFKKIKFKR